MRINASVYAIAPDHIKRQSALQDGETIVEKSVLHRRPPAPRRSSDRACDAPLKAAMPCLVEMRGSKPMLMCRTRELMKLGEAGRSTTTLAGALRVAHSAHAELIEA